MFVSFAGIHGSAIPALKCTRLECCPIRNPTLLTNLYVMGPPKKMRPDQIKVDGEIVDIEKWLDVISKDWDIALKGHTVQPSGARDAGETLISKIKENLLML
jgi:hypothetical protein